jgi:hypothetical protein
MNIKDNQFHFNVKNGKVKVSFKETPNLAEFLQVISTGILATMNQVVQSTPEALRQQAKEELYDMYNAAASNTLSYFAPEIDMRGHLTTQAILEAENKIIEREVKKKKQDPSYVIPFKS